MTPCGSGGSQGDTSRGTFQQGDEAGPGSKGALRGATGPVHVVNEMFHGLAFESFDGDDAQGVRAVPAVGPAPGSGARRSTHPCHSETTTGPSIRFAGTISR